MRYPSVLTTPSVLLLVAPLCGQDLQQSDQDFDAAQARSDYGPPPPEVVQYIADVEKRNRRFQAAGGKGTLIVDPGPPRFNWEVEDQEGDYGASGGGPGVIIDKAPPLMKDVQQADRRYHPSDAGILTDLAEEELNLVDLVRARGLESDDLEPMRDLVEFDEHDAVGTKNAKQATQAALDGLERLSRRAPVRVSDVREAFARMRDAQALQVLEAEIHRQRLRSSVGAGSNSPLASGPGGGGAGKNEDDDWYEAEIHRERKRSAVGIGSSGPLTAGPGGGGATKNESWYGSDLEQSERRYGAAGFGWHLKHSGPQEMKVEIERQRLRRALDYLENRAVPADEVELNELGIWQRSCTRQASVE